MPAGMQADGADRVRIAEDRSAERGIAEHMKLARIRCAQIHPDPLHGGQLANVDALAESIRQMGLLRPVLVKRWHDGYRIVHGERRWRAACAAGLDAVPAYIVDVVPGEREAATEAG